MKSLDETLDARRKFYSKITKPKRGTGHMSHIVGHELSLISMKVDFRDNDDPPLDENAIKESLDVLGDYLFTAAVSLDFRFGETDNSLCGCFKDLCSDDYKSIMAENPQLIEVDSQNDELAQTIILKTNYGNLYGFTESEFADYQKMDGMTFYQVTATKRIMGNPKGYFRPENAQEIYARRDRVEMDAVIAEYLWKPIGW